MEHYRVLLIGGTSHAGKSTLADVLATRLGWTCRSTDKLARHPGRPWRLEPDRVPPHVADHYLSLTTDELLADVLRHYKDNVWPLIKSIVTRHAMDPAADRLILEGSAILPELAVTLLQDHVRAVWLTADDGVLKQRIYAESRYETKAPRDQRMIDRFLERTCLFNERIAATVREFGLPCVDTGNIPTQSELTSFLLRSVQSPSRIDNGL
jgi:2-phosphoglycerate kinase